MPQYRRIGTVVGFDRDDVRQEEALGRALAERRRPGDPDVAESRAKVRAARHRKKEREWNQIRIPIMGHDKPVLDLAYETALVHEILDLLPYAMKEDTLKVLLEGDGRDLRRVGRLIREQLPDLSKE